MRKGSRLFFTLFVVVAFLTSMLFVSCQPKESDEGEAEETAGKDYTDNEWTDGQDLSGKTVNIFGAFVDTDAEKFEKSMVPFEEATGIEVEYEGSGDFESLITVRTEGGDPPMLRLSRSLVLCRM